MLEVPWSRNSGGVECSANSNFPGFEEINDLKYYSIWQVASLLILQLSQIASLSVFQSMGKSSLLDFVLFSSIVFSDSFVICDSCLLKKVCLVVNLFVLHSLQFPIVAAPVISLSDKRWLSSNQTSCGHCSPLKILSMSTFSRPKLFPDHDLGQFFFSSSW